MNFPAIIMIMSTVILGKPPEKEEARLEPMTSRESGTQISLRYVSEVSNIIGRRKPVPASVQPMRTPMRPGLRMFFTEKELPALSEARDRV